MIRPLRSRHRLFWICIPVVAMALIAAGLWARRAPAAAPSVPVHPRSVP
jgi:hypothetical protein